MALWTTIVRPNSATTKSLVPVLPSEPLPDLWLIPRGEARRKAPGWPSRLLCLGHPWCHSFHLCRWQAKRHHQALSSRDSGGKRTLDNGRSERRSYWEHCKLARCSNPKFTMLSTHVMNQNILPYNCTRNNFCRHRLYMMILHIVSKIPTDWQIHNADDIRTFLRSCIHSRNLKWYSKIWKKKFDLSLVPYKDWRFLPIRTIFRWRRKDILEFEYRLLPWI